MISVQSVLQCHQAFINIIKKYLLSIVIENKMVCDNISVHITMLESYVSVYMLLSLPKSHLFHCSAKASDASWKDNKEVPVEVRLSLLHYLL